MDVFHTFMNACRKPVLHCLLVAIAQYTVYEAGMCKCLHADVARIFPQTALTC